MNARLLTVRETAELLRLTTPTIYRRIKLGTLPHVRIGTSYRVPADELEALITGTTDTAGANR